MTIKNITPVLLLMSCMSHAQELNHYNKNLPNWQTNGFSVAIVGPVSDPDCDFSSINAAIVSGADEVRISAAVTYHENVDLSLRNTLLLGGFSDCAAATINLEGNDLTLISGDQTSPVITIDNDNGHYWPYLQNIQVTNGKEADNQPGAGILISGINTHVTMDHIRVNHNLGSGIGISNNVHSDVVVKDAYIHDNLAFDGGGIHCEDANLTITGASAIYSNEAIGSGVNAVDEGRGGGVFVGSGCSFQYYSGPNQPQLGWNGISWNLANFHGGGIYAEQGGDVYLYGQPQSFGVNGVRGVVVGTNGIHPINMVGNRADADENDSSTHGGGIYSTGSNSYVELNGVHLQQNSAPGSGGGVALFDQAELNVRRDGNVSCWSLERCNYFEDNRSDTGGAIFADDGSLMFVRHAWFEDNGARFGSVLYLNGVDTVGFVDGSVIFDNDYLPGADVVLTAIHALNGAELMMTFNTVVNHYVDTAVFALFLAEIDLYGNLIYQDGNVPIAGHFNGIINAECLYVYDNTEISGVDIFTSSVDPFVNRNTGDFQLTAFNFALDACAAHPQADNFDLAHQVRGWDDPIPDLSGLYDIGAYESYASDVIFKSKFE